MRVSGTFPIPRPLPVTITVLPAAVLERPEVGEMKG